MESMFKSLNKSREVNSLDKLDEPVTNHLFKSIEYEVSGLVLKIQHINELSDEDLKEIIVKQHAMLLNYDLFLLNKDTRHHALTLFTNERFLKAFLDVAGLLNLSHHEKVCLNKLAYDYYTYPQKNQTISDMFMQITSWANNKEILILSGMIGVNGARLLAMIRNSSFRDEKCIKRVNNFVIKCGIELSVQTVINVYCYLFERFTPVFIYTMLEHKPSGLTQDQSNRFDAISLAILAMLESLTSPDMKKVLYAYAFQLNNMYNDPSVGFIPVRFSMHTLDTVRYARVIKVINEVEVVEGLKII